MTYSTIQDLKEFISFPPEEEAALTKLLEEYPMRIPDYYLKLIDFSDENDPIRLMCIPSVLEQDRDGSFDTSGEQDNTVIPGLQHKYPQTAMILSTNKCAMYCRHCFRKRLVGLRSDEVVSHLPEIEQYITKHDEISNILISGGDALMNSTEIIARYLNAFTKIEHLDFIRFGSRVPVVLPSRISDDKELLKLLAKACEKKQIVVVTQFNHPRELTKEACECITKLKNCGVVLRNQSVLMRGVNSDPLVLAELLRGLTAIGILPYYIFQCRPVVGVKNRFQVPLREAHNIIAEAKTYQNGFGKAFKYCMSHMSGKIELLGEMPNGEMLFKYHEAKYDIDYGKPFALDIDENVCWLPDDFRR